MRLLSLALLAAGLAGCASIDDLYRDVERYPREWSRDLPDYRRGGDAVRVRRDVNRYVRDVDRAVRLDRSQERRIADRLEDRAYRYLDRRDRRDDRDRRAYPFPRSQRASREVRDWWRGVDRDVERELSRRQRDDYRRFVRRFDDRYERDDDWDDDDWDDDDWDDR